MCLEVKIRRINSSFGRKKIVSCGLVLKTIHLIRVQKDHLVQDLPSRWRFKKIISKDVMIFHKDQHSRRPSGTQIRTPHMDQAQRSINIIRAGLEHGSRGWQPRGPYFRGTKIYFLPIYMLNENKILFKLFKIPANKVIGALESQN